MLLERKNAVIHGGGGAIGGAVARAFAREGARVFLAGRSEDPLQRTAEAIGGAHVAVIDALDRAAVERHADAVVAEAGSIDVAFNVISIGDVQGTALIDTDPADVLAPVDTAVRSSLLMARAAGRHMVRQGSGVLLFFGGDGPPQRDWFLGGLQIALQAVEAMRRQLAAELGRHGVRTVTLRTGGIPESIGDPALRGRIEPSIAATTLLGRAATLEDVGNAAAFAASDHARTLTAATLNISCGAFVE